MENNFEWDDKKLHIIWSNICKRILLLINHKGLCYVTKKTLIMELVIAEKCKLMEILKLCNCFSRIYSENRTLYTYETKK